MESLVRVRGFRRGRVGSPGAHGSGDRWRFSIGASVGAFAAFGVFDQGILLGGLLLSPFFEFAFFD